MTGHDVKVLPVESEDVAELGVAELRRAQRDRIKHRLHVRRGTRNDAENLARRGLLFEGFRKLLRTFG